MYKNHCGLIPVLLIWYYSRRHCNTMTDCKVFRNHIQGMEKAAYFILFIYIFLWLNILTETQTSKSVRSLCLSCLAVKCCMSCRDQHWLCSSCCSSCHWGLVMCHPPRRSLPQPFPQCYWCWKCSRGFMWHRCEGSVQFGIWWEDIWEGLVWAMVASACGVLHCAACGFIFMCVHTAYQTAILEFSTRKHQTNHNKHLMEVPCVSKKPFPLAVLPHQLFTIFVGAWMCWTQPK